MTDKSKRRPGEPIRNAKREAFCQAYAADPKGNATAAARAAGYADSAAANTGYRLLLCGEIKARIDEIRAEIVAAVPEADGAGPDYVLGQLKRIADESGSDTARVRALELLGKVHRLFVEVTEERTPEREMTDEECIAALIETLDGLPHYREAVIRHLEEAGDVTRARPRLVRRPA